MTSLLLSLTCALLGVLAAACLLPAQAHALRRRVLLVGLLILMALPLLRWFASIAGLAIDLQWNAGQVPAGGEEGPAVGGMRVIAGCWLLGTAAMLLRLFVRWRSMLALAGDSEDASESLPQSMHRIFAGMGQPQVRVSPHVVTACVALWKWKPVVLLPGQAAGWRTSTLRAVLRHELEHARRGDLWWRLAGEVALALWWWHPLAHVVLRRWSEACEQLCDDAVLKSGVRPESYARSLLTLAGGGVAPTPAPAMSFLGRSPSRLRRRVASILSHHGTGHASPSWVACVAIGVLALVLGFAATVHLQREDAAHREQLQTEAQLRLDANPFPADP
ncbi:beta-lactamase regulating signal transducer with metallopeptidase domain [Roseimicrobium gellanilyticum]|uniref:Beta-lactamase regulating signal transducer with metallopeptidase domain n=1 Tax=Roseimicrobium gellanilyticum TaxID=748857 RepID=A0A366HBY5_9BACT|nr:M56 family metallopeptidase [Roseimicrobium gellanilyticum]RBP39154.1 beta-lactamase regulating signal transducer with metallopeptidase domain [Roseimicrobium gellanilyticum]